MKQFLHNGVMIPAAYEPRGFTIKVLGKQVNLTPLQEEMAVKFVQKFGTPYVEDKRFCANFMEDFAKALGIKGKLAKEDVDWSPILRWVESERARKANMPKDERKKLAAERKLIREQNKERYGWATVDGQKMELGNYAVEPPSIFMGRGRHPKRGKWKASISTKDVELNLSPNAPMPPGEWKGRVWRPDEMWVARWVDPLAGKVKYIWLAEHTPIRQEKFQDKFKLAEQLDHELGKVRAHINEGLVSPDERRRKVATVAALIDLLKLRVGDEKDVKEEADTVGATTLRRENIAFNGGTKVEFDFLGKDSVRYHKEVELPNEVVANLKEFVSKSNSVVFDGISSNHVRDFFREVMPGLSPKVFRTYAATNTFRDAFKQIRIKADDDDTTKLQALQKANAAVAELMNHQKAPPKRWKEVYDKRKKMLAELEGKETKSAAKRRVALKARLENMRLTKTLNLGTSLKNYISPYAVKELCDEVQFDWRKFYPKALVKKFSFLESDKNGRQNRELEKEIRAEAKA